MPAFSVAIRSSPPHITMMYVLDTAQQSRSNIHYTLLPWPSQLYWYKNSFKQKATLKFRHVLRKSLFSYLQKHFNSLLFLMWTFCMSFCPQTVFGRRKKVFFSVHVVLYPLEFFALKLFDVVQFLFKVPFWLHKLRSVLGFFKFFLLQPLWDYDVILNFTHF